MDYDLNDDKLDIEIGKNLFWFDGPIGRFRYFIINLVILIAEFVVLVLLKEIFTMLIALLIIFFILAAWIIFVATAKRLYDITASLKIGIIISLILMLAMIFFPRLVHLLFLIFMFIPGKMIKNNY